MDKTEYRKLSILAWENAARTYLVGALLLLTLATIFVITDFNNAVGPIDTLSGKVAGIAMGASNPYHVPREIARIALQNGAVVSVTMPSGLTALAGDAVTVAVYRHRLSGSKEYRVVRVERRNPTLHGRAR